MGEVVEESPLPQEPILTVSSCPGRLQTAYDVGKAVGKGGYAVVHRGVRREDGRVIAVKKVEIFEMSPKKRDRCLQEVTLLAQLKHPYIIQMLDAFIDENMLIIIFEWAPAGDLKRLIKKTAEAQRTLDEPAIWSLFSQVVNGLRYMHQHRIMHRDIKPANVLVGANGALKLGDLGLGRQLSEQTMEAFSKVGTPYYVSPEVVRGAGYDWKSDVWSLGCLLYELAVLRSPFEMEGANLYDVFQKISKGQYEPLPADQFSPTLRKLVSGMLHVDPAGRPELEEVWNVTSSVIEAQARVQQDVHAAAELIHGRLLLLEEKCIKECAADAAAVSTPVDGKTGRRVSSKSAKEGGKPPSGRITDRTTKKASTGLPTPPRATLRLLHPAYFACPLGAMPAFPTFLGLTSEGEQAKQQLGTYLTVFAWLLRVGGWSELAPSVEAHVAQIPVPGPRPAPRPRSGELANRPSSREANGIEDQNGDAAAGHHRPRLREANEGSANGGLDQIKSGGSGNSSRQQSQELAAADGSGRTSRPHSREHQKSAEGRGRSSRPSSRESATARPAAILSATMVSAPSPPRHVPCPPSSLPASLPVCSNLLKGAEAAKVSAQRAGLATDFIPVVALASGHGRAPCALLLALLDAVAIKVPIAAHPPVLLDPVDAAVAARAASRDSCAGSRGGGSRGESRSESRGESRTGSRTNSAGLSSRDGQRPGSRERTQRAGKDADKVAGVEEEETIVDDGEAEDEDVMLTAASRMPDTYLQSDKEEMEEGGNLWERLRPPHGRGAEDWQQHRKGRMQQPADQPLDQLQSDGLLHEQGQELQGGILKSQVDPLAWRVELERLTPALSRIHVQDSSLSTSLGAWALKWQKDRQALCDLVASVPPLLSGLQGISLSLARDLEALRSRESRINSEPQVAAELGRFAQLRSVLEGLQRQVAGREQRIQSANAELAQLHERLAANQEEISQFNDNLDGSMQTRQIRAAIHAVKSEMQGMDLRVGLLQQQLSNKERRHFLMTHCSDP